MRYVLLLLAFAAPLSAQDAECLTEVAARDRLQVTATLTVSQWDYEAVGTWDVSRYDWLRVTGDGQVRVVAELTRAIARLGRDESELELPGTRQMTVTDARLSTAARRLALEFCQRAARQLERRRGARQGVQT